MTTFGPKPEQGPPLSKETRLLLDEMMRGQNVSAFRRKKLQQSIQEEASLPMRLPKTSRKCPKAAWKPLPLPSAIFIPTKQTISCGKKPLRTILQENPLERDQFRGAPCGRDQEAEKDKLARIMQFKGEPANLTASGQSGSASSHPKHRGQHSREQNNPETEEDVADALLKEVEERRKFLDDMRKLGKAGTYDAQIMGEIATRLKQIEGLRLDAD